MNIEIHGFAVSDATHLRDLISKCFEKHVPVSLHRQTVITIVTDDVRDRFGKSVPFIRVYNDNDSEFDLVLSILRKIEFVNKYKPSIILECCVLAKVFEL